MLKEKLTTITALAGAGMYASMLLACGLLIVTAFYVGEKLGTYRGRRRFQRELIDGGMAGINSPNVIPLTPRIADDPDLPSAPTE